MIVKQTRVLIADDEPISRRILESTLRDWNYEVLVTSDGREALSELSKETAPQLAILDVVMPGIDGLEVCRRVRQLKRQLPTYIILLTSKADQQCVVQGLKAGADDYISKPFDREELQARAAVGMRMIDLQTSLALQLSEKADALAHVRQLQDMLPICSYCKAIRDDSNYWQSVDSYVSSHTNTKFSHGICPACYECVVKPQMEQFRSQRDSI